VLWEASARQDEVWEGRLGAASGLKFADYDLFVDSVADVAVGRGEGRRAQDFAELWKASVPFDVLAATVPVLRAFDATDAAASLAMPVLVVHHRDVIIPQLAAVTRRLATIIPNAQYVILPGSAIVPAFDEPAQAVRALRSFLGVDSESPRPLQAG
jgi:pimeloyl-ACP methyl ester carboxylesterase